MDSFLQLLVKVHASPFFWPVVMLMLSGLSSFWHAEIEPHAPRLVAFLKAFGWDFHKFWNGVVRRADPTAPPLGLALLVFAGGLLLGFSDACVDTQVQRAITLDAHIVAAAEPCLVAQYKADQQACLDTEKTKEGQTACVARTRAAWKPLLDDYGEIRDIRCEMEPGKCAAPAAPGGAK